MGSYFLKNFGGYFYSYKDNIKIAMYYRIKFYLG